MAMGRKKGRQQELWVATPELARGPSHPFYSQLNQILARHEFDAFVEELCAKFYAKTMGRPSIPPGVYFRGMLMGFFEGIDSERGIAWRVADSLSLREFLGCSLTEAPPDHSTLSRTRRLIDLETHAEVFQWVLGVLAKEGFLKGKTLGIDATTLEANAALRSIVRRDTGESYPQFLERLAKASGIETPSKEDLIRFDQKRSKTTSNKDWRHPGDPDARITKMKDGRTHLAHKAEHAVDLETGAIVAVTLQGADQGDTTTIEHTEGAVHEALEDLIDDPDLAESLGKELAAEVVADKGYHSNAVLVDHAELGVRTYISEPDRGRRRWKKKAKEKAATYANRRRIRGARGKRLSRLRSELVERSFAHCYDTGGMRRTHLRHHANILKRLLIHVAGFNLSLILRELFGMGKPRSFQGLSGLAGRFFGQISAWARLICASWRVLGARSHRLGLFFSYPEPHRSIAMHVCLCS